MFPTYCCCCLKPTANLLPVKTKSSQEDGKTLLDYLNTLFGVFPEEYPPYDFICPRCSKALQVAYHFINMVGQIKGTGRAGQTINTDKILEKPRKPSIRENDQYKNNNSSNESQLEFEISNENASNSNLKMLLPAFGESNKLLNRAGSAFPAEKYDLKFMCHICNTHFNNKNNFVEHNKQNHKEIIPYKCRLCSFYTCYAESLFKHCEKLHGLFNVSLDLYQLKQAPKIDDNRPEFDVIYSCTSCNFEDSDRAVMEEHLLNEHSIEDGGESCITTLFSCPSCCRSFASLKSAKIHFSMVHICSYKTNECKKRTFSCEKCGKLFDLKSGLLLHRLMCEKRRIVNCNFCDLECTSVLKYERHLQDSHFVAIKHECETCSKTFNCSEYLAVHRKRHNERNFQCDLCPKNYISNAELKVHKRRIHDIKQNGITCSACKKKFASPTLLKYHENTAHKARTVRCDYCDFVSNSASGLKTHLFNHTGKPYRCHLCEKEFAFRFRLRQHLKKQHSTDLSNGEMAEMFKQAYVNRYDAFAEQNNDGLDTTAIKEIKLENKDEQFGLTFEGIVNDLFQQD